MIRVHGLVAAAVAMAAVMGGDARAAVLADGARATPAAVSKAVIVKGSVVIGGSPLTLKDEITASGSAPPAYSKTTKLKSYKKTTLLPDDTSLVVTSGAVVATAASKGLAGTQVAASASTLVTSGNAVLTNSILGQVLSISAKSLASNAKFTRTTAGAVSLAGGASFTSLVIDLNAFGGTTLKYSGKPKANTVLYKSSDGSVIVYLNRQVKSAHTPAVKAPTSFEVQAVEVHLTNASAFGLVAVSGDLEIGTCYAE
jgi:hypothetical protein